MGPLTRIIGPLSRSQGRDECGPLMTQDANGQIDRSPMRAKSQRRHPQRESAFEHCRGQENAAVVADAVHKYLIVAILLFQTCPFTCKTESHDREVRGRPDLKPRVLDFVSKVAS